MENMELALVCSLKKRAASTVSLGNMGQERLSLVQQPGARNVHMENMGQGLVRSRKQRAVLLVQQASMELVDHQRRMGVIIVRPGVSRRLVLPAARCAHQDSQGKAQVKKLN